MTWQIRPEIDQTPNSHLRPCRRLELRPRKILTSVRVIVTAVNMLMNTPMASVTAKPSTALAPKLRPNVHKMKQITSVAKFESRIVFQAQEKPVSIASPRCAPLRSSSLIRSNTSTLASTAIPVDKRKPVIAGSVNVTPTPLNTARLSRT